MKFSIIQQALCLLFTASVVLGQGYVDQQDYYGDEDYYAQDGYGQEGDSLYHDYAAHQEKKAQGGNGYVVVFFEGRGIPFISCSFLVRLNNCSDFL